MTTRYVGLENLKPKLYRSPEDLKLIITNQPLKVGFQLEIYTVACVT